MPLDFISALLIGLAGAGHCIAMCGGISSLLVNPNNHARSQRLYIVCYNMGRITSYTLIGAVVGFSSSLAVKSIGAQVIWLKVIASVFLILLGCYVARIWFLLTHIESIGKVIWRYIQPLSKPLLPVDSPLKALALGSIWGWLPCGLVYSTLTWSMASGNAIDGALIMLAFGLGTLPALLAVSTSLQSVTQVLRNDRFRKLTGLLLIFYGFYSLLIALNQIL
ncbi:sulfite exporter TauE/SafE family protein [Thalassotalea maritima]|uniref:sulfite exporter TauE/SafE family protein n=1 Tax=Thalassotalea maritima TaxID=3242416 RepID=UPI003528705D